MDGNHKGRLRLTLSHRIQNLTLGETDEYVP